MFKFFVNNDYLIIAELRCCVHFPSLPVAVLEHGLPALIVATHFFFADGEEEGTEEASGDTLLTCEGSSENNFSMSFGEHWSTVNTCASLERSANAPS